MRRIVSLFVLLTALVTVPAFADMADVIAVDAAPEQDGSWRFSVTVRHPDTGWDHYADRWEVRAPDGRTLDVRVLLHPHVDEQPFTRSLGGVIVPEGVDYVTVRAHCSVDGHGGEEVRVEIEP